MNENAKLPPKKLKALETLLAGGSKRQAAAAAGVGESQLYRWRKDPVFAAELASRQAELLERVNNQLLVLALRATNALAGVIESPDSQSLSLKAIDIALSKLMSIRELSEIESRLRILEQGASSDEKTE